MENVERINESNFNRILNTYMKKNNLSTAKISKALCCSKPTLERLLMDKTIPTDEMIKQAGLLIAIGIKQYDKMSKADKEKYSETIGTISGAGLGFASISAVVSSFGIAGLSGPAIMSGLAAIGGYLGAGAIAGITVVAVIPVLTGIGGYALIKGIKKATGYVRQQDVKIDKRWEKAK